MKVVDYEIISKEYYIYLEETGKSLYDRNVDLRDFYVWMNKKYDNSSKSQLTNTE